MNMNPERDVEHKVKMRKFTEHVHETTISIFAPPGESQERLEEAANRIVKLDHKSWKEVSNSTGEPFVYAVNGKQLVRDSNRNKD